MSMITQVCAYLKVCFKIPTVLARPIKIFCIRSGTFLKAAKYAQKHLLRVEEMQHTDWLICLLGL